VGFPCQGESAFRCSPRCSPATGPDLLVNVELKASGLTRGAIAALVDGVAAVVADAGAGARVLVSSFNPFAVGAWMRRVPTVGAGLLFERDAPLPLRRGWAARWLQPVAVHPEIVLCTPGRVAGWRRRGYMVNVWTVDGREPVRACRALGVDARDHERSGPDPSSQLSGNDGERRGGDGGRPGRRCRFACRLDDGQPFSHAFAPSRSPAKRPPSGPPRGSGTFHLGGRR
jgi:hypothetical protein